MKIVKLLELRHENNGERKRWALFSCKHCGRYVERRRSLGQRQRSCGCIRTKHGDHGSRLYEVWAQMRWRCKSKTCVYYGARGITVCKAWRDYANFRQWALANGYRQGLFIDRINPDGNYTPTNCRWLTPLQSFNNSRIKRDRQTGRFG